MLGNRNPKVHFCADPDTPPAGLGAPWHRIDCWSRGRAGYLLFCTQSCRELEKYHGVKRVVFNQSIALRREIAVGSPVISLCGTPALRVGQRAPKGAMRDRFPRCRVLKTIQDFLTPDTTIVSSDNGPSGTSVVGCFRRFWAIYNATLAAEIRMRPGRMSTLSYSCNNLCADQTMGGHLCKSCVPRRAVGTSPGGVSLF